MLHSEAGKTSSTGVGAVQGVADAQGREQVVWQACSVNCGSRCALRLHVRDGRIAWVGTDDLPEHDGVPQMRACLRGRAMKYWLESPDRLNYPLRRTGPRGSGQFERITWDEALDEVAAQIRRIRSKYGNDAILMPYATGLYPAPGSPFACLLNCVGGFLETYGDYSCAQLQTGMTATFGDDGYFSASTLGEAAQADVVVLFGSNPFDTRMGGAGAGYEFMRAKERGCFKLYSIDPRHTDVVGGPDDVWLPILPGTDAALVAGVACVLIEEGMVDQEFLDRYCIGYDPATMPPGSPEGSSYKEYVLGLGPDGVKKTPEWASRITGVPTTRIVQLARDIGGARRAFVAQGWGPQRSEQGESTSRAISMLAVLTGNVGLPGTNGGMRERFLPFVVPEAPVGDNPVKARIPAFMWLDAVEEGPRLDRLGAGVRGVERLGSPVKMIVNHAGNCLTNQHADINRVHDILSDETKCEFIVCIDVMMTDSAKYADIVLPDLARAEAPNLVSSGSSDIVRGLVRGEGWEHDTYDRMSAWDMALGLAERLGVAERFLEGAPDVRAADEGRLAAAADAGEELPTLDELHAAGVWRTPYVGPTVAYEDFRRDPDAFPLPTPSGKIEIYSQRAAELSREREAVGLQPVPALPVYVPASIDADPATAAAYPYRLVGFHGRQSTHSSFANVDELQSLSPRELSMNPLDAAEAGLSSGDAVAVESPRGVLATRLRVTPRIMPGVVALPQGAWHDADMAGSRFDWGGCINTLTSGRPTTWAHANPHNTCCVLVRPLSGDELEEARGRV